MREVVPLVMGFLLTTVLGGLLGYFFQRRNWSHQHEVQGREQERERAVGIFEEVSRLLDKRLYRLRQLHWTLIRVDQTADPSAATQERMAEYRVVLYEWNDSINRNLALVQQYFGRHMRDQLDYGIGNMFVQLGRQVELRYRAGDSELDADDLRVFERGLFDLSSLVYSYNVDMIQAIQQGNVGLSLTGEISPPRPQD